MTNYAVELVAIKNFAIVEYLSVIRCELSRTFRGFCKYEIIRKNVKKYC